MTVVSGSEKPSKIFRADGEYFAVFKLQRVVAALVFGLSDTSVGKMHIWGAQERKEQAMAFQAVFDAENILLH